MSASIEVRVPLLQKDLVSHFFRDITIENKSNQKYRLKSLLKKQMKHKYKKIKKQGFRYPINEWIRNDIRWDEIISYFNKNKIINTIILNKWLKISDYDTDLVAMKLWHVYTLYIWLNTFSIRLDD